MKNRSTSKSTRHSRLAAGVWGSLAVVSPLAMASTVTSCDDGATAAATPGTLRYEIAHAAEGATIDFDLPPTCNSTITLMTGALAVGQNDLTITGSAAAPVTLTKYVLAPAARLITHTGAGTLHLNYLALYNSVYNNKAATKVLGGCVYSSGSLSLYRASVSKCQALVYGATPTKSAYGGGIYVKGDLHLVRSTVSSNATAAIQTVAGNAYGGCAGVDVHGYLYARYATISGNAVETPFGSGGGACLYGGGLIVQSTISGNRAGTSSSYLFKANAAGGILAAGPSSPSNQLTVVNSTVSGNYAYTYAGGIQSTVPTRVFNSTIASNSAGFGISVFDNTAAAGVALWSDASFIGTLIAGNETIKGTPAASDLSSVNSTVSGGANLVFAPAQAGIVPADTIVGTCPLLGPLRDNGGPTLTHALRSGSPAIDKGALFPLIPATKDQRGLPRSSPDGYPDIGAYEVQQNDILFNASFEGCTG